MNRKKIEVRRNVESSSSDSESSESSSDHISTPPLKSASDIINSFLKRNEPESTNVPRFRSASDVINSFLHKKKTVTPTAPFRSALDIINSYLQEDKTCRNKTSSKRKRTNRQTIDLTTSDSDSSSDYTAAKKRRIESSNPIVGSKSVSQNTNDGQSTSAPNIVEIRNDELATGSLCDINLSKDNVEHNRLAVEETNQSVQKDLTVCPARRSTRLQTTSQTRNRSIQISKKSPRATKSQPKIKDRVVLQREYRDKKDKSVNIIDFQVVNIKDCRIPKAKYDRALEILESKESRFDETPVDYSPPTGRWRRDVRRTCELRRYDEAIYDDGRVVRAISMSRILCEMQNCLQKEKWQQLAELIYFGCDLLTISDHTRNGCGTTFFTYGLLLLLLDSNPDSLSTLEEKQNTLRQYLFTLGNDEEDRENFLKKLNVITEGIETISTAVLQLCQSQPCEL